MNSKRGLANGELKRIQYEKDELNENIDRMCKTNDAYNLMSEFLSANRRLKTIHDICVKKFIEEKKY